MSNDLPTSPAGAVSEADRKQLTDRLARVEGQLRGIQRLIDRGEECEPVAQQLAAARRALDKTFARLIACAIAHRIDDSSADSIRADEQIDEILALLTKYT